MFLNSTHRQRLTIMSLLCGTLLIVFAATYRTTMPAPVRMGVKELMSPRASITPIRPIAVVGRVKPSSRHYKGYSEWWFTLEDEGREMPVHYTGRMPSTFFEEGAKVLVTGTIRDGTFSANGVAVSVWM